MTIWTECPWCLAPQAVSERSLRVWVQQHVRHGRSSGGAAPCRARRPYAQPPDLHEVNDLLPYLESVTVDDQDWEDDLDHFRQVWDTFVDRYGFEDRTFTSFPQHIVRWQRSDNLSDGVRLVAVHKAQGREFGALALAACNERQIPDFRASTVRGPNGRAAGLLGR